MAAHRDQLDRRPNSFFTVSLTARSPSKSTVAGNRYIRKFLRLSEWTPKDLKVIAGKLNYPALHWYDAVVIQLIMRLTGGPTDRRVVVDYTDWSDVDSYSQHLLTLVS